MLRKQALDARLCEQMRVSNRNISVHVACCVLSNINFLHFDTFVPFVRNWERRAVPAFSVFGRVSRFVFEYIELKWRTLKKNSFWKAFWKAIHCTEVGAKIAGTCASERTRSAKRGYSSNEWWSRWCYSIKQLFVRVFKFSPTSLSFYTCCLQRQLAWTPTEW